MKKFFSLAFLLMAVVSCKSLPERFDEFITDVEASYESYTDIEWKVIEQKYAEFEIEFMQKYDNLTAVEKEVMNKCFGRYGAVVTKAKFKSAADGVKRFFESADEYIEGLVEGLTTTDSLVVK